MKLSLLFAAMLVLSTGIWAQVVKKSLDIDDFASWKVINNQSISNNGKYIIYELNPQKGDGVLIISENGSNDTIPRGSNHEISPGNDYVAFRIKQPEDSIRKAKVADLKKDKYPKDSIGVYLLKKEQILKFPRLVDFKLPEEPSNWIAFMQEEEKLKNDTTQKDSKAKKTDNKKLILLDVSSADTLTFKTVTEYFYAPHGQAVFFVREKTDSGDTTSVFSRFDTRRGEVSELYTAPD